MKTISDLTTETLIDQIKKGQQWLRDNSQKIGTDLNEKGEKYNGDEFLKKLEIYEAMVDEYKFRGFDEVPILKDNDLLENEKKIRLQLANMDTHNREYSALYSKWSRIRVEGLKRNLYKFFIPSRLDANWNENEK